jgi:signal transduction histidine kinase
VSAAWLLVGVVLGSQAALEGSMQGSRVVLTDAIRTAWVDNLPWIPATLIAVALSLRFPLRRQGWKLALPVHLVAVPLVSWITNVGVVLRFWVMSGSFEGLAALARQAAFWATVRLHVAALVYGLTVALTHVWIWLRDSRARELRLARLENQLSRARYQALNAQIRPHFLFNTLHTIGQLWRSGRSESAEAMLDRLGSLFQRVRATTESAGIPLRDELSMVEDYLAIEQARFADRLHTVVEAAPATRSCLVPPLLLQPLVENAIRHGVSAVEGEGCVRVEASEADGVLTIEICDNGPGLAAESARPGMGTGVSNTRERLRHAFGDEASLTLASRDAGGVCATVCLPVRRDPDADFWDDE